MGGGDYHGGVCRTAPYCGTCLQLALRGLLILKLIDTRDEYTISRVSAGNESSFSLYTYRIQENLSSCLEIFSIVPSKRTQIFPLPIHLPPLRSNLSPFEFLPTTFTRAIPKYASLVPNTAWEKTEDRPGRQEKRFFELRLTIHEPCALHTWHLCAIVISVSPGRFLPYPRCLRKHFR